MTFGERIRELRKGKDLTLRDVARQVEVNFTYLSKIENHKLDFGDYPSEELIHRLGAALNGDVDELLLLAKKIPAGIRERVIQRPDVSNGHPATTPYDVAAWWVKYLLPQNSVLLDCFCGSATMLAAALDFGASRVIGI